VDPKPEADTGDRKDRCRGCLVDSALRYPLSGIRDGRGHPAESRIRTLNFYSGPLAAYNAGDFSAAEQAWRAAIARTPRLGGAA